MFSWLKHCFSQPHETFPLYLPISVPINLELMKELNIYSFCLHINFVFWESILTSWFWKIFPQYFKTVFNQPLVTCVSIRSLVLEHFMFLLKQFYCKSVRFGDVLKFHTCVFNYGYFSLISQDTCCIYRSAGYWPWRCWHFLLDWSSIHFICTHILKYFQSLSLCLLLFVRFLQYFSNYSVELNLFILPPVIMMWEVCFSSI